jgi:hypothetical protein
VPILLGKLSGIDESLFINTNLEPQLFNSFNEWYQNRISIFGKKIIDNILISEFDIDVLSVNENDAGFFGEKGFYSKNKNAWFCQDIDHKVLSGVHGFLLSKPDLSGKEYNKPFSHVFLSHLAKSTVGKPVRAISVFEKGVFIKTNQNSILQYDVRSVDSVFLEGQNYNIPSSDVWDIDEINSIIKSSSSGGLVVFSGVDADKIAKDPRLVSSKNSSRDVITLDSSLASLEEVESAKKELTARNSVVLVLSKAKNFIDLYEELKSMFTSEKVILHLSHYEIRIPVDKLCKMCKEDSVDEISVSRISLGFNLMPGEYASAGSGCSNCVGGYEGSVVIVEKLKSSELTSDAIVNYEKERSKEFISPSVLVEKNKDVRNVYKELNTRISHKEVSIKDGLKAVL